MITSRPSRPLRTVAARLALALTVLGALGCDFYVPTGLPCFTCPQNPQLAVVGDSVTVVGNAVQLRAMIVGTSMGIFIVTEPAADARWTLTASPPAQLVAAPASTRDTTAVVTARLIPSRAGRYTVVVTWREFVARHTVQVNHR